MTTTDLLEQKCTPQTQALSAAELEQQISALDGWTVENGKIVREFGFGDYYETLAFINAIAYVIHAEDHHPELVVTYNRCIVRFDTHSVNNGKGGLSINDFICATKVNAIFQQSFS
ncbi:MAG: 4a-hydroxytetrahydrobiopterin dehydratase [Herbaspirillum sp.]|nr:4a-hydroxytetrahydrobiopterin dehydratase [Herbaspirillum sp.]